MNLRMRSRLWTPNTHKLINDLALAVNVVMNIILILFLKRTISNSTLKIGYSSKLVEYIMHGLAITLLALLGLQQIIWIVLYAKPEMSKRWRVLISPAKRALAGKKSTDSHMIEIAKLISKPFIDLSLEEKMKILRFKAQCQGQNERTIGFEYGLAFISTLLKNGEFYMILFFILVTALALAIQDFYVLYSIPLFSIIVF